MRYRSIRRAARRGHVKVEEKTRTDGVKYLEFFRRLKQNKREWTRYYL